VLLQRNFGISFLRPFIPKRADKEKWKDIPEITAELLEWVDKMMSGLVFFDQLNCGHTCSADD